MNARTAYTSKTANFATKKIQQRKSEQRKKKRIIFGAIILLLLITFVYLARSSNFLIAEVYVSGARDEYNTQIRQIVLDNIGGNYAYFLPKRNTIFLNKGSLEKDILSRYSVIKLIKIERSDRNTLQVTINERTPLFKVVSSKNTSGIYVDDGGTIYQDEIASAVTETTISESAYSYASSTPVALPVDFANAIGKQLPQDIFSHIQSITLALSERSTPVYSIVLRPYGDADFNIGSENNGALRIHLSDDTDKVMRTYFAAKRSEPLKSKLLQNMKSLQYIDLRFGDKVFYKFGASAQTVGTSTVQ